MKAELERRASHTAQVLALFRGSPLVWIDSRELERVGGRMAWRTRVSDARRIIKAENGGDIENRYRYQGTLVISAYRYVPYVPVARDAGEPVTQKSLF